MRSTPFLLVALAAVAAAPASAQPACPTTCAAFTDPPPGQFSAFTSVTAAVGDGDSSASCRRAESTGGRVAACVNGTLRDVATAQVLGGEARFFLNVGGGPADDEDAITFRYCPPGSTGAPLALTPGGNADNTPTFRPNRAYGSASVPYRLETAPGGLFPMVSSSQSTTAPGAGWRQIAAPVSCATVDDVLGSTWTQGFPGADLAEGAPNVFRYDETAPGGLQDGYRPPASQAERIEAGAGYFVYLYADDDFDGVVGAGEGFPKTFAATGPGEPAGDPFAFSVTYTQGGSGDPSADGWNLVGNPFPEALDWDAIQRAGVAQTVYVYDPALPGYRQWNGAVGDLDGGLVAPWQGFWVQTLAPNPSLVAPPASRTSGGAFRGRRAAATGVPVLELRLAGAVDGRERQATAFLAFMPDASPALDPADGHWLAPLDGPWLALATETADGERLKINALPASGGTARVPLRVSTSAEQAVPLVLTWPRLNLGGRRATLVDAALGVEVDLESERSYAFEHAPGTAPRFALVFSDRQSVGAEGPPLETHRLGPIAPNPVRGRGSLTLAVGRAQHVRAVLYDALGREVATAHSARVLAGRPARLPLDAGPLPPGLYVLRVTGEDFTESRPFTVAR